MKKLKTLAITVALIYNSNFLHAQIKVKEGGRVGIGTNDVSQYKLNVHAPEGIYALNLRNLTDEWGYNSKAEVSNGYTKTWVVNFNGNDNFFVLGEGSYWYKGGWMWSDQTLKQNIQPINNSLPLILGLRGVYYNYKPETLNDSAFGGTVVSADTNKYIGLIAQEVENIVPEVVRTNDKGVKGVAYQNLVALLIEGIKEQQGQIELLKSQIEELQNGGTPGIIGKKANTISSVKNNTVAQLYQNVPNPFNQNTVIEYEIFENFNSAILYIYNCQGEQIKSYAITSKGKGSLKLSANELKAGIYLYDLIIDNVPIGVKRMVLTQ